MDSTLVLECFGYWMILIHHPKKNVNHSSKVSQTSCGRHKTIKYEKYREIANGACRLLLNNPPCPFRMSSFDICPGPARWYLENPHWGQHMLVIEILSPLQGRPGEDLRFLLAAHHCSAEVPTTSFSGQDMPRLATKVPIAWLKGKFRGNSQENHWFSMVFPRFSTCRWDFPLMNWIKLQTWFQLISHIWIAIETSKSSNVRLNSV